MVVRYQAELPSQDLSCSIKTQLLLDKDYNHPWPFYCAFLQTIRKCPEVGGRLQDSFSESPHPAATRESPDSHLSSGDWIDIALGSPREVRLRKLNTNTQWIHWGRGYVSIIHLPCCPTLVFRPSDGSTRRFMPASRGLVDRTQTGHGEEVIYWRGFDTNHYNIDLAMVCRDETDCDEIWEIIRSLQCDN